MRPNEKPFVRLPVLAKVSKELENCVYCPKLCRTTCPVSNAVPRETFTPGVKMSFAYHMGRGDVPLEGDAIETAYACTNCHACTQACDHKNPVADVLYQTRRELFARGYAPKSVREANQAFHSREEGARKRDAEKRGTVALAGGCGYDPKTRENALRVASFLVGTDVVWIEQCCGKPLRAMGDESAWLVQQSRHASERQKYAQVFSIDAGCSEALHAEGVPLLLALVRSNLEKFDARSTATPLRYHDSCALGRGLGMYREPREVLERISGAAPQEFIQREARAACSGGGGLVPTTLPEVASKAAALRASEHAELGGGTVVTSCASSLRSFKGARADAVDLFDLLAAAIPNPTRT